MKKDYVNISFSHNQHFVSSYFAYVLNLQYLCRAKNVYSKEYEKNRLSFEPADLGDAGNVHHFVHLYAEDCLSAGCRHNVCRSSADTAGFRA